MSNTILKEACKQAWGMSKQAEPRRSSFEQRVWNDINASVRRNEAAQHQYLRSGKAVPTYQQQSEYMRKNQPGAFKQTQTGKYPERKTFEGGVYDITEEQIRRIPRNAAAAVLNGAGKFVSAPATVPASLWGLALGWTPWGHEVHKYLDYGSDEAVKLLTTPSRWLMDPKSSNNEKLLVEYGGTGLNLVGSGVSGRLLQSVANRAGNTGKVLNHTFGLTGDFVDGVGEGTKRVQTAMHYKMPKVTMTPNKSPLESFDMYVKELIRLNPGMTREQLKPALKQLYISVQPTNRYTANADQMVDWWLDAYKDQYNFPEQKKVLQRRSFK